MIINGIIVFFINSLILYSCHKNASKFYNERIEKHKTFPKLYDLGIRYTPDLSKNINLSLVIDGICLILPFLFGYNIFIEFISLFTIVTIIRWIFISVTILPKFKHCSDNKISFYNYINGHCYDKVFSGHISTIFLLSLILYSHKIINIPILIISNMIWIYLILCIRYHYSVDILVSIVVCLLVFQNRMNYKIAL